jgi:hypothetical protein
MPREFLSTAEIYLVNEASVDPQSGNFANAAQIHVPLYASNVTIPFSMSTEDIKFLGTNGSYTQVMGPEPTRLEMNITSWTVQFLKAILGRDENNRVFSKYVTFLIQAKKQEQGSNDRKNVQFIVFGRFIEGDLLSLEAGAAQSTDYTFSAEYITIKTENESLVYNLVG